MALEKNQDNKKNILEKLKSKFQSFLFKRELVKCLEYVNNCDSKPQQKLNALLEIFESLKYIKKANFSYDFPPNLIQDILSLGQTTDDLCSIFESFEGFTDIPLIISNRCQNKLWNGDVSAEEVGRIKDLLMRIRSVDRYLKTQEKLTKQIDALSQRTLLN